MLWVVGNFAFVTSCFIFSIGKPFRASLISNIPFTICFIIIIALDFLWVFCPDYENKWIFKAFILANYVGDDGKKYYYYRWIIFGAAMIQMISNYVVEKFLVRKITTIFDARDAQTKVKNFETIMEHLLEQNNGTST
jgi:hypothetical protein